MCLAPKIETPLCGVWASGCRTWNGAPSSFDDFPRRFPKPIGNTPRIASAGLVVPTSKKPPQEVWIVVVPEHRLSRKGKRDTPTGEKIVCVNPQGDAEVKVVSNPKPEHVPNPRPNPPGERHAVGELWRAGDDKDHLGKQVKGRGGLPKWAFINETANFDTGAAVNILPPNPNLYPSGCIQILRTHPLVEAFFNRHVNKRADFQREEAISIVEEQVGVSLAAEGT